MTSLLSGDLLIIMAQVITAAQMVYEEKVVGKYNVHPLKAVGLEGRCPQQNKTIYSLDNISIILYTSI